MTMSAAPAPVVARGYEEVAETLRTQLSADKGFSAQVAAFVGGRLVVDLWGGSALTGDSLIGVYSVSKGLTGLVMALLVERGVLDLDAPVAAAWPEFARAGKERVTVRQLLSHQAGLPEVDGGLTSEEYFDDRLGAARLARQRPLWSPGSAWGYHAVTIGMLANELTRRLTGCSIQEIYEEEIRAPLGLEAYLGLPEVLEPRVAPVIFPPADPDAASGGQLIDLVAAPLVANPGIEWMGNSPDAHRIGMPAAGGVASARGIAGAYAAALDGRLFSAETLSIVGQIQTHGHDITSSMPGRFGILFQKPHPARPFAGYRAIGHDGAAGSLGFADPDGEVAFGFTTNRPAPEGGDRRADDLAAIVLRIARGRV